MISQAPDGKADKRKLIHTAPQGQCRHCLTASAWDDWQWWQPVKPLLSPFQALRGGLPLLSIRELLQCSGTQHSNDTLHNKKPAEYEACDFNLNSVICKLPPGTGYWDIWWKVIKWQTVKKIPCPQSSGTFDWRNQWRLKETCASVRQWCLKSSSHHVLGQDSRGISQAHIVPLWQIKF